MRKRENPSKFISVFISCDVCKYKEKCVSLKSGCCNYKIFKSQEEEHGQTGAVKRSRKNR